MEGWVDPRRIPDGRDDPNPPCESLSVVTRLRSSMTVGTGVVSDPGSFRQREKKKYQHNSVSE